MRLSKVAPMFSLALLLLASGAYGQVVPDGNGCFTGNVKDALARVRASSKEVDDLVKELEMLHYKCRVSEKRDGAARTFTQGNNSRILWPGRAGRLPDDSCISPDVNLVHELYHCSARARNNGVEDCPPLQTVLITGEVANMPSCEAKAVEFENRFRKIVGMCERTTYDNYRVPGVVRTCTVAEALCPPPLNCSECCCWVYGGIKNTQPDGRVTWGACVIPHDTGPSCHLWNDRGGQYSAGCYDGPDCSQFTEPRCSGLK